MAFSTEYKMLIALDYISGLSKSELGRKWGHADKVISEWLAEGEIVAFRRAVIDARAREIGRIHTAGAKSAVDRLLAICESGENENAVVKAALAMLELAGITPEKTPLVKIDHADNVTPGALAPEIVAMIRGEEDDE